MKRCIRRAERRLRRAATLALALATVLSGALAEPVQDGTGLDGTALDGTALDGTGLDGTGLDGTGLDGGQLADFGNTAAQAINFEADLKIGYVAGDGAQINPMVCYERDLVSLNRLVFESVVELDENLQPAPQLADSWSSEGTTWTFKLRSGIVFHNGAELTAEDVVLSYRSFAATSEDNPYYNRVQLISSMEATDAQTVTVVSKMSGYVTLYAMTFPVMQAGTLGDTMARGTGPYWYTQYDSASGLRLEVNPLWWKQSPKIQSIAAVRYADSGDELQALQTKAIDLISTQSSSAALSRKLSTLTSMDYQTLTYEMLVPNLNETKSVMSDVRMRQAVMYAIDRAVIAANGYLGMATQCEVPVDPSSWLYESQSAIYYYSPERALSLILDMGWQDLTGDGILNRLNGVLLEDLTVSIITYNEPTSSVRENAANLIATYLRNIGVNATVTVYSKARALTRINERDFDLALIGVNLSEVPNLTQLLSNSGTLNLNGYGNDEMNSLLGSVASAATAAELKSIYSQIQMKVVDRLPFLGIGFRRGTVLSTRSLAGLSGISANNSLRGIEFLEAAAD